eukprot:TRINITY_DN665_c0_g1_i1.p1 TRINITY_DN665_c0_g1~~TRINITY_DN665_c0_g1_i1.p1  ORF type:complete len:152 (-),score=4.37 TRINITY_DN665_c0_g1_i1:8-463(-)
MFEKVCILMPVSHLWLSLGLLGLFAVPCQLLAAWLCLVLNEIFGFQRHVLVCCHEIIVAQPVIRAVSMSPSVKACSTTACRLVAHWRPSIYSFCVAQSSYRHYLALSLEISPFQASHFFAFAPPLFVTAIPPLSEPILIFFLFISFTEDRY